MFKEGVDAASTFKLEWKFRLDRETGRVMAVPFFWNPTRSYLRPYLHQENISLEDLGLVPREVGRLREQVVQLVPEDAISHFYKRSGRDSHYAVPHKIKCHLWDYASNAKAFRQSLVDELDASPHAP